MRDGKIILKKKKVRHKILFFILFLAILFLIGYQIGICSVKQSLNSIKIPILPATILIMKMITY